MPTLAPQPIWPCSQNHMGLLQRTSRGSYTLVPTSCCRCHGLPWAGPLSSWKWTACTSWQAHVLRLRGQRPMRTRCVLIHCPDFALLHPPAQVCMPCFLSGDSASFVGRRPLIGLTCCTLMPAHPLWAWWACSILACPAAGVCGLTWAVAAQLPLWVCTPHWACLLHADACTSMHLMGVLIGPGGPAAFWPSQQLGCVVC